MLSELPRDARPIPGYPDFFITPRGEVISQIRGYPVELYHRLTSAGYVQVGLTVSAGKRRSELVHRLLGIVFIPGDHTLTIDHRDGNPLNNNLDNLRWMTRADNVRDGCKRHPDRGLKVSAALSVPVIGRSAQSGEELRFPSAIAAAKEMQSRSRRFKYRAKTNGSHISRSIKEGTSAYGYFWRHA